MKEQLAQLTNHLQAPDKLAKLMAALEELVSGYNQNWRPGPGNTRARRFLSTWGMHFDEMETKAGGPLGIRLLQSLGVVQVGMCVDSSMCSCDGDIVRPNESAKALLEAYQSSLPSIRVVDNE